MSELEVLYHEVKAIREDISELRNMLELIGAKLGRALPLLADVEIRHAAQEEADRLKRLTSACIERRYGGGRNRA